MRHRPAAVVALAATAMLVTACQAAAPGTGDASIVKPDPVAELAIETLASRLGVPRDEITVDSVAAVDWIDSSAGCPQPGMAYLTVITPGHKVLLEANGQTYAVHEASGHAVVCEQPGKLPEDAGGDTRLQDRLMLTARLDLAKRLGVRVPEIQPGGVEPKTFSDASLDCPEAGMQYAQALTDGFVLTLRHGGRDFTYHADAHHVVPCP
jgi:hypothetical protein